FTFINAALLRDLPVDHPERVVALQTVDTRGREYGVSYLDFRDWAERSRTLAGIAASAGAAMNLSDEVRPPERVSGAYLSANAFELLGRSPIAGRGFRADDDRPGAAPVVIIGHALWTARFGGDPAIL